MDPPTAGASRGNYTSVFNGGGAPVDYHDETPQFARSKGDGEMNGGGYRDTSDNITVTSIDPASDFEGPFHDVEEDDDGEYGYSNGGYGRDAPDNDKFMMDAPMQKMEISSGTGGGSSSSFLKGGSLFGWCDSSSFCGLPKLSPMLLCASFGVLLLIAVAVTLSTQRLPVNYKCASPDTYMQITNLPENYDEDKFNDYRDGNIMDGSLNITDFLENYRHEDYDDWGNSYLSMKEAMRPFKEHYMIPFLKKGATLYESATGIGLNLQMTLEILKENTGNERITVYGNEFLPENVEKANVILNHISKVTSHHQMKVGNICPGDSSHLSFVPSNSFDVVYTGYIQPILNPLHLEDDLDSNFDHYTKWCDEGEDGDFKSHTLARVAQESQERFFNKWVMEMIRIAKPGAPILVEQVSAPICEEKGDFGGVSRDWWREAAELYEWDIDMDSLEQMDDTVFDSRYHVFMLKSE